MYRVSILLKNGQLESKNLISKDECDTFILETMEKEDIKRAVIQNQANIAERYVENF